MVEKIIELKNISKTFPNGDKEILALIDINIIFNSGELVMVTGPSGCGKTTMLSVISGILSPTVGEIIIDNILLNNLSDFKKVELRRKKIGFIFQQFNLLPSLTAAENAAIPLIGDNIKWNVAIKKSCEILKKIDMQEQINKYPNEMSGGQQQRVAIARALVHDPKIIICDEPTASLDAKTGKNVMNILKNNAKNNKRAVIIVTHDYRIFEFADRIVEMDDGKIISDRLNI